MSLIKKIKIKGATNGGGTEKDEFEIGASASNVKYKTGTSLEDAKPTYTTFTILASGWQGDTAPYSHAGLKTKYPTQDVEIYLQSADNYDAFSAAKMYGGADNTLYACGEKPTVDIIVGVKVVEK